MSLAMTSAVTAAKEGAVREDGGMRAREREDGGMRPLAPLNPMSPASRRGSAATSRRPSAGALGMTPMSSITSSAAMTGGQAGAAGLTRAKSVGSVGGGAGSRRPSGLAFEGTGVLSGLAASMAMSALEDEESEELPSVAAPSTTSTTSAATADDVQEKNGRRKSSGAGEGRPRIGTGFFGAALSMSAVESDDDEDVEMAPPGEAHPSTRRNGGVGNGSVVGNGNGTLTSSSSTSTTRPDPPTPMSVDTSVHTADPETKSTTAATESSPSPSPSTGAKPKPPSSIPLPPPLSLPTPSPALQSPADLAAQLFSNPKLAALRSPTGRAGSPLGGAGPGGHGPGQGRERVVSAPILMNNKCSGYFVEPVRSLLPPFTSTSLPLSSVYHHLDVGSPSHIPRLTSFHLT